MKKKQRSLWKVIILVASAFIFLTACGKKAEDSAEGGKKAEGKTKITWALWDKDATTYYEPLIEAFEEENPDIEVEMLDLGYTDYMTVLGTQLSGGSTNIDVATIKDMPGYASLVNKNQLEPLSELAEGVDLEQYGGVVEQIEVDDEFYALPYRNDFYVLYYNKSIFDEAGIDYPKNNMTWDEYSKLVEDLSKKATDKMGRQIYGGHYHIWRSQVQLYGILNGKNTLVSDDYKFLEPYYATVLKQQKAGYVQDYSALKTSSLHYSAAFYQNNVGTMLMGTWFIPTLAKAIESGESENFDWGITTMPLSPGAKEGSTAGTITSLGINKNSKNKEAAYKFIAFASGKSGADVVANTGTMPAIQSEEVIKKISRTKGFPTDDNSKAAVAAKQVYLELPLSDVVSQVETILNDAHDNIMSGNSKPEDELKSASKQVKALK